MRKKQFVTIIFFICIILNNNVFAEKVSDVRLLVKGSALHNFIFSQNAYQKMYEFAVFFDRKLSIDCNSRYEIHPKKLNILVPINLPDGASEPTEGAWKYQFEAERCNQKKIYNMLAGLQNDGIQYGPLMPGNSISSPILKKDAMKAAFAGAVIKNGTTCRENIEIYEVETVQFPDDFDLPPNKRQSSWVDKWVFLVCGKIISSEIEYTPDGNGGTDFKSN